MNQPDLFLIGRGRDFFVQRLKMELILLIAISDACKTKLELVDLKMKHSLIGRASLPFFIKQLIRKKQIMTKIMNAGEYYRQVMLICNKNAAINDQLNIDNDTNVLYYIPTMQLQANGWYDQAQLDQATADKALTEFKETGKVSLDFVKQIGYYYRLLYSCPEAWSMKLDARLFDENSNLLLDRTINKISFTTPVPNQSYTLATVKKDGSNFTGVAIPFPMLENRHNYQFELIEHWFLNPQELFSGTNDNKLREFTRKITIPVAVNEKAKLHLPQWLTNASPLDTQHGTVPPYLTPDEQKLSEVLDYTSYLSFAAHPEINEATDKLDSHHSKRELDKLGPQSILLTDSNVPCLHCDPAFGIFNEFYGNFDDAVASFRKLANQHNLLLNSNIELYRAVNNHINDAIADDTNGFRQTDNDYSKANTEIFAALGNAFVPIADNNASRTINHNNLGVTTVSMDNLLHKRSNRFLTYSNLSIRHHSRYDFEEYLPQFGVCSSNREKSSTK